MNVFLTSLVCAQYGSPAGNSNPGYGGSGISVPSGDYGYKGQKPVSGAGVSDGNSEVSSMLIRTLHFNTNHIFRILFRNY